MFFFTALKQSVILRPCHEYALGCLQGELVLLDGHEHRPGKHHDDFEDAAKVTEQVDDAVDLSRVPLLHVADVKVESDEYIFR